MGRWYLINISDETFFCLFLFKPSLTTDISIMYFWEGPAITFDGHLHLSY